MSKNIIVPAVWALMLLAAPLCPARAAQGGEDEDFRVMSMGEDPAEKSSAGASEWEGIFKANNRDKLTGSVRQRKKAELAEDFDTDALDTERLYDWYGAAEDCRSKGRLPTHKELLKIWDAECKESTSTACSAVYWTSERKGEMALGVNFLNGYVVQKELDAFAYFRCVADRTGKKAPAASSPKAKAGQKKGADTSAKIPEFVRNYRPVPDGPRLEEKMSVMITGAGGSAGAVSWDVRKKGPGLFVARAVVPVEDSEIQFTFSVNFGKKTVAPADARARALFKAITDPDIAEGSMR